MPGWLQPIADANPFTMVTNATRALYNGNDPGNDVYWSLPGQPASRRVLDAVGPEVQLGVELTWPATRSSDRP